MKIYKNHTKHTYTHTYSKYLRNCNNLAKPDFRTLLFRFVSSGIIAVIKYIIYVWDGCSKQKKGDTSIFYFCRLCPESTHRQKVWKCCLNDLKIKNESKFEWYHDTIIHYKYQYLFKCLSFARNICIAHHFHWVLSVQQENRIHSLHFNR